MHRKIWSLPSPKWHLHAKENSRQWLSILGGICWRVSEDFPEYNYKYQETTVPLAMMESCFTNAVTVGGKVKYKTTKWYYMNLSFNNNKHKRVLWVYYMYKYIKIIWINNQQHENERLLCSSIKTINTKLALEHLCCAYLFSVADVAR